MRVRTGRFTTREYATTSYVAVRSHPPIADGHQPLARQPRVRHPGLRRQGFRQVEVTLATERREDRLTLAGSQCQQVAHARSCPAPLFPIAHPDPATQPV